MFKEYILNDLVLIGSASFPGEHILGAVWFHNGKKVVAKVLIYFLLNQNSNYIIFNT